jgi:hypothetical protein
MKKHISILMVLLIASGFVFAQKQAENKKEPRDKYNLRFEISKENPFRFWIWDCGLERCDIGVDEFALTHVRAYAVRQRTTRVSRSDRANLGF